MEITFDLAPDVVRMLDVHRAALGADRSAFMNYIVALYDQNTRQAHQQMQYSQQPVQQYRQPAYDYDDSGYIGPVEGLEPVQTVRQSPKVCRDTRRIGTILNGGVTNRQPKPKAALVKSRPKTVPRKTR